MRFQSLIIIKREWEKSLRKSLFADGERCWTHCGAAAKEENESRESRSLNARKDDKHLLCKNTPHKHKWNVVDVLLRNWSSFTSVMPVIVVNQLLVSVLIFFPLVRTKSNLMVTFIQFYDIYWVSSMKSFAKLLANQFRESFTVVVIIWAKEVRK